MTSIKTSRMNPKAIKLAVDHHLANRTISPEKVIEALENMNDQYAPVSYQDFDIEDFEIAGDFDDWGAELLMENIKALAWSINETYAENEARCIKCGCVDSHACSDGCEWVLVNRDAGFGLCSRCIEMRPDDDDLFSNQKIKGESVTVTLWQADRETWGCIPGACVASVTEKGMDELCESDACLDDIQEHVKCLYPLPDLYAESLLIQCIRYAYVMHHAGEK